MNANRPTVHVDDDTCVDLVLELLPHDDARAVLKHIEQCVGCEQRLREVASEHEHLLVRTRTGELRDALRQSPKRAQSDRPPRFLSMILAPFQRRSLRLGAGVAVVAAIVLMLLPRTPDRDLELLRKLPPFTSESERRTQLPMTLDDQLISGIDAYERNDFDRAIRELAGAKAAGPHDLYRQIYMASALAMSGQYEESTKLLEALPLDLIPEPWSSEARWTLFFGLRATERTARADSLLRVMAREPGEVGERARSLEPSGR